MDWTAIVETYGIYGFIGMGLVWLYQDKNKELVKEREAHRETRKEYMDTLKTIIPLADSLDRTITRLEGK